MSFQLAKVFKNRMILQRDEPLRFFGKAKPGVVVTVQIGEEVWSSEADQTSSFEIVTKAFKTGISPDISISALDKKVVLRNCLFGDVFLVSGQSNIEYRLKQDAEYEKEQPCFRNLGNLRFYNLLAPDDEKAEPFCWEDVNGNISAVAYYFAKQLRLKNPAVPIGIVGCFKGGTSISSWLPEAMLRGNSLFSERFIQPFEREISGKSSHDFERLLENYQEAVTIYTAKREKYIADHPELTLQEVKQIVGHTPWPPPATPASYRAPGMLYTKMFSEAHKMNFSAVLWYQGEEDAQNADLYDFLLEKLVQEWRIHLGNKPFFIVQLPKYQDAPKDSWALLREKQESVTRKLANLYLVVTIDCGESYNIHPISKRAIGERISFLYEKKESSPMFERVEKISENHIKITIKHAKELTLMGENCVSASFHLKGNCLFVDVSPETKKVTYAYENHPEGYLVNEAGVPVSPFKVSLPL
ncbi:sialate O-acetylesterase [Listeria goaensis]|uniref:sialate O-acetylesterase n=1 Tax=Listeria goaensis TaxID=1649188 RepID=UPI000B596E5B|nr:sialate O-acetylesterase [Listeria goaensis]